MVVEKRDDIVKTQNLYDADGELLLGGFNIFKEKDSLLLFHFGGKLIREDGFYDDTNGQWVEYEHPVEYYHGNERGWLITNQDLKPLLRNINDKFEYIKRGDIINNFNKNDFGKNLPTELFIKKAPIEKIDALRYKENYNDLVIIENKNHIILNRNSKSRVIRISDCKNSMEFDNIKMIDNKSFFVSNNNCERCGYYNVGISTLEAEIIKMTESYKILTIPNCGKLFGFKICDQDENTDTTFDCYFIDLDNQQQILVKNSISSKQFSDFQKNNFFHIFIENDDIYMYNPDIFKEEFRKKIKKYDRKETANNDFPIINIYYNKVSIKSANEITIPDEITLHNGTINLNLLMNLLDNNYDEDNRTNCYDYNDAFDGFSDAYWNID